MKSTPSMKSIKSTIGTLSITKPSTPEAPEPDQNTVLASQLTDQYRKAISGIREVIIFGAMMMKLREVVSTCGNNSTESHFRNSTRGPQTKGEGIKGWLTEHAPEIHLSSAYRFMELAEGAAEALKVGKKVDLHLMLTAPDEELGEALRKKRAALWDMVDGKSQRQLLMQFGSSEPASRGGARQRRTLTVEEAQNEFRDRCREETISSFKSIEALGDRFKVNVTDAEIEYCIDICKDFIARASGWIKLPQKQRTRPECEPDWSAIEGPIQL